MNDDPHIPAEMPSTKPAPTNVQIINIDVGASASTPDHVGVLVTSDSGDQFRLRIDYPIAEAVQSLLAGCINEMLLHRVAARGEGVGVVPIALSAFELVGFRAMTDEGRRQDDGAFMEIMARGFDPIGGYQPPETILCATDLRGLDDAIEKLSAIAGLLRERKMQVN